MPQARRGEIHLGPTTPTKACEGDASVAPTTYLTNPIRSYIA
jgi:hypothetical protein